ncbi:hypothetical protein pEaSNUABM37_00238 [Erwinia phage pEa_SNUABM_37]|nr:hypothetical protein pEaSNUABM37_00238 [Erwinia phage pEa_SNUABM_37]QXO10706.1 hypothetical protein pEaSNUABM48_00238 [Erwinia phage pEa_SNUABM_48]
MTSRNAKPQSWDFKTATIGDLTLELKIPQDPTLSNDKGEVDLPIGRIRGKGGIHIVGNLSLPVADFSNLITEGYRHLVLGKTLSDDVVRSDAIEAVVDAMKWLNYNGASQLISQLNDAGQFEYAGNMVTYQRQVSGSKVVTSYNTQTLATEDGTLRQGTWTLLESNTADVRIPLEEYNNYACALAGEDVETAKG